ATRGTGIGGGVGTGIGTGTGTGAAAPRNLWSFILRTPEQKQQCRQDLAKCKARFCNSKIGQMANGLLLQASPLTAGILGPVCPLPSAAGGTPGPNGGGVGTPDPAALAMPANTPEGAAARIRAAENPAVIKAKIAAIQSSARSIAGTTPRLRRG